MLHAIALTIVLHMSNAADVPGPIIEDAQREVVRLYRDIGVEMEWHRPATAHRADDGNDPRDSDPLRTPASSTGGRRS